MLAEPTRALVYLDSKDIIDIERGAIDADLLPALFKEGRAALALSFTLIDECIEPLRRRQGGSVTRVLNILEATPHLWLRDVDLEERELSNAVGAFASGHPPIPVVPFCNSYLDTLLVDHRTRYVYQAKPLAVIVWDQAYGERTTAAAPRRAERFPDCVRADRELISTWDQTEYRAQLRGKFDRNVRRILGEARSSREFLDYLWSHPDWSPATRFTFEAYHTLVRDRGTNPTVNDVNDFTRLMALPYVDVFTADGAKRDLLRRLQKKAELSAMEHWSRIRILKDVHEVIAFVEARTVLQDRCNSGETPPRRRLPVQLVTEAFEGKERDTSKEL